MQFADLQRCLLFVFWSFFFQGEDAVNRFEFFENKTKSFYRFSFRWLSRRSCAIDLNAGSFWWPQSACAYRRPLSAFPARPHCLPIRFSRLHLTKIHICVGPILADLPDNRKVLSRSPDCLTPSILALCSLWSLKIKIFSYHTSEAFQPQKAAF